VCVCVRCVRVVWCGVVRERAVCACVVVWCVYLCLCLCVCV